MDISVLGVFFGILLLAVPLFVIYRFNIALETKLYKAFGKLLLVIGVTAFLMKMLLLWNNLFLNLLCFVLMAVLAAFSTVTHARMGTARFLLPSMAGILLSSLFFGLYFLLLVLSLKNPFDTRFFLPVMGLLIGGVISVNAQALHVYYSGLRHHAQLYDYLRGNGSTHGEAVTYFLRRAMQRVLMPYLKRMGTAVTLTTPFLMWALLAGGVDPIVAAEFEVLLLITSLAAGCASLLITLWVARRYAFDAYGKLKS